MYDISLTFVTEVWIVLCEMAPYLLFGFFAAGVLSVFISPGIVERHLGGRGIWPIIKATIFGIPLPLCSCGVIPVTASLRRHNATKGAATAFLISTPQTGVDSILVTFALLGPLFAVFRPLAALVNGILGGMIVSILGQTATDSPDDVETCNEQCCNPSPGVNRWKHALRYGFITLSQDLAKPLIIGLLIAAVISAIVPSHDYLARYVGTGVPAMLAMMLVSIPLYVCATASVPVAAALIGSGISPGAALVFLMTGPATNAAAIATIWKIMGRRTALVYLVTVAVTALACGLILDHIFTVTASAAEPMTHGMMPHYVKSLSAIVLLALLTWAILNPSTAHHHSEAPQTYPQTVTLTVGGMACSHCASAVERALGECSGVEHVSVDLKAGTARVSGQHIDANSLLTAIDKLGYNATHQTPPAE